MSSALSARADRAAERQAQIAQRLSVAAKRAERAATRRAEIAAAVAGQPIVLKKSWLARSRAWISLLLLLPVVTLVLLSRPHFAVESTLAFTCTAAGYALFLIGMAWRWWATLYIGGVKDREVVSHGPYSVTRNPLYFGTLLIAISFALQLQSLSLAITMAAVAVFYLKVTVANEESRLTLRMGQAYTDYCRRVPRFWPRLSLYQSGDVLLVEVTGIKAEAIRALRYAFLPLAAHGLILLRAEAWWLVLWQLP